MLNRKALLEAALRCENSHRPPVWLMRQAGRYMKEYRALKEKHTFQEMCDTPELAIEVSLLPHRLLDVDALIVFYDILIPLEKMGAPLSYGDGGPRFHEPVRDVAGLESLHPIDPREDTPAILETIAELVRQMDGEKAVLGFAGAPFTLASYLVEGRLGQGVETLKKVMFQEPEFLHRLLRLLTDMTIAYLGAQLDAGASAVQLFDTWAGHLGRREYEEFVQPYHQEIFRALGEGRDDPAATILYIRDSAHLIDRMDASGATALSIEWRSSLCRVRKQVGSDRCLQGNLDPTLLFASPELVVERTREILEARRNDPGFIFNLGHGILPGTPVECVRALVETVQNYRPES